jgi:hypothetical protein
MKARRWGLQICSPSEKYPVIQTLKQSQQRKEKSKQGDAVGENGNGCQVHGHKPEKLHPTEDCCQTTIEGAKRELSDNQTPTKKKN